MAMARSRTVACTVVAGLALAGIVATGAHAATGTTAWRDGSFSVNVPNLVRRSDVVLRAPNAKPEQAMPLGNETGMTDDERVKLGAWIAAQ